MSGLYLLSFLKSKFLFFPILLFVQFLPKFAFAGAWLPQKGDLQIITNSYVTTSSDAPIKGDFEIYSEYGLNSKLAIITQATISDFHSSNFGGNAAISLRMPIFKYQNWISSTQIGAIVTKSDKFRDIENGYEARISIGRGYDNGIWLDGEIGARYIQNQDLIFWEYSIGKKFKNDDLLILKGFNDDYLTSVSKSKIQLSYVHNFANDWALEIGWRQDFLSYNDEPARGVVIGLWRNF